MKKPLLLILAVLAFSISVPAQTTVKYTGSGAGFHLGFDILDRVLGEVDAAFDFGGQADIAFSLGAAGEAHYCPSFGFFFGGDNQHYIDYSVFEFSMNIADLRYYFPIPQEVKARPFIGLGPMLAIDHWNERFDNGLPAAAWELDDTRPDLGFNMMAGCDFLVIPNMPIYVEMRGKLGDWDVFKFTAGMNFVFAKR